jgi:hypothetical protein
VDRRVCRGLRMEVTSEQGRGTNLTYITAEDELGGEMLHAEFPSDDRRRGRRPARVVEDLYALRV